MTSTPLGNAIVTQVAIVVRDIEQAVEAWSALLNMPRPNIILTDTLETAHRHPRDGSYTVPRRLNARARQAGLLSARSGHARVDRTAGRAKHLE